jgi:PAS domain S-box-containing protein
MAQDLKEPSLRSNRKSSKASSNRSSPIIGSGDMADLTRAFDWKGTVLGAAETWPDTLLTTVNLLLASRHPMFLWWGRDLIQFYNDGYRPSIRGDKHPSALGQRGVDCWPEIWPIIGPQIEAVMSQGQSTWNTSQLVPINRSGKLEEVFWTYGYSPVRDKDGSVQGTLVVCSETTEQVLSERRLRTLLGITGDFLPGDQSSESQLPLLKVAQDLVGKLGGNAADVPFASLYLLAEGENLEMASTASMGSLSAAENWPLAEVVYSQTPLLLEDLQRRFGELIFEPWPEPVTQAYVLPLRMPASPVQAILVSGISPRLPFDESYKTFLQLVGARIAGLLQSQVHQIEVAEAAKRFHRLAEANPFGTVIGDLRGQLRYVNPALLKTLGYSEADVAAGKVRWDKLTPPEYAHLDARAVEQLRSTGRCDVYEKVFVAKDGRGIPVLLGAAAIDSAGGDPEVAAFVTDLTPLKYAQKALQTANEELEKKVVERTTELQSEILDRKRAEISLRELTGRLLRAQDEERRHLARELHDHAGQTLVAMALNLEALLQDGDHAPRSIRIIKEVQKLSDDLSKEIRTLSYLLHPPLLDEVGLTSALRFYVEGFSKRSKIEVDLELPEDASRLSKAQELIVFRVVQESLTNVHRHSGSQWAKIQLSQSSSMVKIEIVDKGKGISSQEPRVLATARMGVGVRGMEERVRQFGGSFQIESGTAGTRVSVTIPLIPK